MLATTATTVLKAWVTPVVIDVVGVIVFIGTPPRRAVLILRRGRRAPILYLNDAETDQIPQSR
jgi:hypothetical protein